MKSRFIIRTVITISIVLLCAGFGIYSFYQLNAVERQQDFNLYELVPADAVAVLETDMADKLVEDINQLDCSKDNHFLYVSDLFSYLKKYLSTLTDETPHGLSRQMNKMLISFHEPESTSNQILYCALGTKDYELVETFIRKFCSSAFPVKYFDYKGAEIRIYPMSDGRFLSVYLTSDYVAVSFQKRLIEQVIDARISRHSLLDVSSFKRMRNEQHSNVAAKLYLRMRQVDMGMTGDESHLQSSLGNWAEFDIKCDENAIYCSGISQVCDTARTWMNVLQKQQPVSGFGGERLPVTTLFYDSWSMSDVRMVASFASQSSCLDTTAFVRNRDEEWLDFLHEHAADRGMFCLFLPNDTAQAYPAAVLNIPMKNAKAAERKLRSLVYAAPYEKAAPVPPAFSPKYALYPEARRFAQYLLPRNTMLARFTGISGSSYYTFACFYRGDLLLAPDAASISAYIARMERGEVLDGTPFYEEGAGSLSPTYNFVMMADMGELLSQPRSYVRMIPSFFFKHGAFFQHFILSIQFTCTDGVVYPNIVLLYKPRV